MKFAITIGLPFSGKSVLARHIRDTEGHIIIDTNEIRKAITGEVLEYSYSAPIESFVIQSAIIMAKHYLSLGCSVIVDSENLTRDSRNVWYDIAIDFKLPLTVYWANTPYTISKKCNELYGELPEKVMENKSNALQYPSYRESKAIRWINVLRCDLKNEELVFNGKFSKTLHSY